MTNELTRKIDALPPLPQTLMNLEKFKSQSVQETTELLKILEKDPLILSTLLKISNSAMFGFRHRVETAQKAIELIGINFTLSISFGSAIKSTLETNLNAYNISSDEFIELASLSSNLLSKWVGAWDITLKDELLLPVFLQDVGKFVLSDIAGDKGISDDFCGKIKNDFMNIDGIEIECFKTTSTNVSASMFKQWKLDNKLVSIIENISTIETCPSEYLKEVQILNIIKILTNCVEPLSDKSIEFALIKAEEYNLDTASLKKAITLMQDRILDA
ncbi:MAG TPA: HDOD domain-containing protein [Arcobacter sp.]|nr:HDOD domain-containing protein [Arcobacter sp.]HIP55924.1 HDOD domain-containing protein [Arcobacter sp.]